MMQAETFDNLNGNNHRYSKNSNHSFYEAGQLRRAKMHAARLIDSVDKEKMLTPALHRLLEASLVLETTDSKVLAAHLKKSPAAIRSEFQRICEILGSAENAQNDLSFNGHRYKSVVNI